MKKYFTVGELIEELKKLPLDAIPIIADFGPGHEYVFARDTFDLDEFESPYFGNDSNITSFDYGEWIDDEWKPNKKFYQIAGI